MDILYEVDPIYWDYTVTEGNQKVLYVHIAQAIYGMLVKGNQKVLYVTSYIWNASLSHALLLQAD